MLHAAVSADDGESWRGYREVFRDPRDTEPPPVRGDHGTAYPFPVATADDRVLFASSQGSTRRALSVLDPAATFVQLRESLGPCYLRLRCGAEPPDAAGFLIDRCSIRTETADL